MVQTAPLLIDLQVGNFDPEAPIRNGEQLIGRAATLLATARDANAPVIFIQNQSGEADPDLPGTPGYEIHPALEPLSGEPLIAKTTPDSFLETGLQRTLDDLSVTRLVVAGLQTEYCVDTTCRSAWRLGYDVTLVNDAHSTWDSDDLAADQIIAHHNRILEGWFVTLATTGEINLDN